MEKIPKNALKVEKSQKNFEKNQKRGLLIMITEQNIEKFNQVFLAHGLLVEVRKLPKGRGCGKNFSCVVAVSIFE